MPKIIGFDTETYPEKHIERVFKNRRGGKIRQKTLFPSFLHLENYCKTHGIDISELDSTLTIEENVELLRALLPKTRSCDLASAELEETDYLPDGQKSYFSTQEFYSAQFYNPKIFKKHPKGKYCTTPLEVEKVFRGNRRGAIFLANNAEFDFAVLCKVLDPEKFRLRFLCNGARFLWGKINECMDQPLSKHDKCPCEFEFLCSQHQFRIYDLMNIFSMWPLAKIGKFIGVLKMDKPEYLGKRKPETEKERAYFENYALRDAEIGYYAGNWLLEKFGKVNVSLPSLAFGYFNKNYKPAGLYLKVEDGITAKLRLSYKGGRVEAWVRGSPGKKEYVYDVVSLYPSVMKEKPYPMGINGFAKKSTINLCHDGLALCTVKQDAEIPFLCLKTMCSDGNIKLIFPNGVFKAWFTYPELRYFSLSGLGKIIQVHEALETQGSKFYFKDYVDEFFNLKSSDKDHADFWKLCMNALYGKFAQDAHSPERQVNLGGSISQIEDFGNRKEKFQTNILASAYVSAYGRIKMHKNYLEAGAENLSYTDTDSIHSFKKLGGTGKGLGELDLKLEGQGTYIRSKFYLFNDLVRCRGMERIFDAKHIKVMIERNDVSVMSKILLRLRSAYRQHKPFLTESEVVKNFSLNEDCKRAYLKVLKGGELLSSYTTSEAIVISQR